MPSNPVDHYTKLLNKDQQENDEYALLDAKWFEQWKRFVGLDGQADKKNAPGPIDFSHLTDPSTLNHPDGVQLRLDAVEGNDYTFIPVELYRELVQTYKKTGEELIRKVIPSGDFQTVIETYLIPLRLRKSRQVTTPTKQIYRSRRTKLDELKKDLGKIFALPADSLSNYRLYTSTDEYGDNWEMIDDRPGLTLSDVDLSKNALITYEPATATSRTNLSPIPTGTFYVQGLCGLSNLGNTCFMNSALQCISNVPQLTDYFLRRDYLQHINRDNPLGMKGDVAQAYGDLVANMWSGKISYHAPKTLKQNVARYAPQFSGYSQQDSQEFMSFLLDGLHEDLNLVKQKPYVEKRDDDGTTEDTKLAAEQWDYYRKRNQSKIHDIFHGQIKSVVQCLDCKTLGRTFDPICFLSLPLPNKKKIRLFKIEYIRLNGQITYYYIKSNERGRMHNLLKDFCERFQPKAKNDTHEPMESDQDLNSTANHFNNQDDEQEEDLTLAEDYDGHQPKPELILPVEVYNHRIHLQYNDDALLTNILERDQIVFYEVPVSLKKENNETILMPCLFRTADSLHQNFGLPIYLNIPRHKCTGKHIQDALQNCIGHFLPFAALSQADKVPYVASCVFNQNYTQTTKPLASCLDDHIDFNRTNTTLVVDVAPSIVDRYEQEEKRRLEKERQQPNSSTSNSGVQTRSQHKQATTTLLDCFKYFTTKETLSDNDQWYCPKCKQLKNASKKIDLWLLPKVLIVQLKRFNYTRHYRDKIDLFIDCPLYDLDLSQFVLNPAEKANAKYDLIAVSNHMGGLGGGHYTAHGKNIHDQKWHTFDDSCVTDIDEGNVISKSAYVLIYQQQQSQSPSQSQPVQQQAKDSPRKTSARTMKTST